MARPQKIFRIENHRSAGSRPGEAVAPETGAIIAEIRALRALMEPQEALSQKVIDAIPQGIVGSAAR